MLRHWALFSFFVAARTSAAIYTITTLAEDTANNGNCTLREALLAASTDFTNDQCVGDAGPDTIVLDAVGTYSLQAGAIASANRQLTIRGDGDQPRTAYAVNLQGAQRLLYVLGNSSLTLENFTVINGFVAGQGGAVLAEDSDLTLRRMAIKFSSAADGGGVAFKSHGGKTLDVAESTFDQNSTQAGQSAGGGLYVDLQAGGTVRIVASSFLSNEILSVDPGGFSRAGAGLFLQSFAPANVELRHLDFFSNMITAPSFSIGAGARIVLSNQTAGSALLEDLDFENNSFGTPVGSNSDVGLSLNADDGVVSVRRVRLVQNHGWTSRSQVSILLSGASQGTVSDLLAGNGDGWGVFLSTSGSANLLAGNLTVAGHPDDGLVLAENSGTLRVENSIAFGNATASGSNLNVFNGTPDVSAENLVGVDPQFLNAAGGDFRLGPASVAANAGNQAFASVGPFDAAHGDRIVGIQLDLGALERSALFSDDFEHGDLYAWSTLVP
ncbi:MAG: CSLREA domain-containing protein [Thermoanaerobaculia bacterium]